MSTTSTVRPDLEALRAAAGPHAVSVPAPGRWTVHGHAPAALVAPRLADDVAATLALCSAEGWTVEPAGAGTWLDHGRAPAAAPAIVLSTHNLADRIETEPADLVAGADAGVPLAELQRRLAADRQELQLDPPGHRDASLGAIVALASAGPLRAAAGTPRDHVLGVTVATGDGRLLRFGGRVVKNVAGYDMTRLITGSRGTLGVITSLWVRLRAVPAADRTLAVSASGAEPLADLLAGLGDIPVSSAELMAPATARALGAGTAWLLAVRLRGGVEEVATGLDHLRQHIVGLEVTSYPTELWGALARLEAGARGVVRAHARPSALGRTIALCEQHILRSSNEMDGWHLCAHGLDGSVRAWPAADTAQASAGVRLEDLRRALEAGGGGLVVDGAAPGFTAGDVRGTVDPVTLRLESELKNVMDPAGILAPGRWP